MCHSMELRPNFFIECIQYPQIKGTIYGVRIHKRSVLWIRREYYRLGACLIHTLDTFRPKYCNNSLTFTTLIQINYTYLMIIPFKESLISIIMIQFLPENADPTLQVIVSNTYSKFKEERSQKLLRFTSCLGGDWIIQNRNVRLAMKETLPSVS